MMKKLTSEHNSPFVFLLVGLLQIETFWITAVILLQNG